MNNNVLVVYYTHSGNTEKIAKIIASQTGGTLLRVEPQKPYPKGYNAVVDQAKKEIAAGFMPPIAPIGLDVEQYDTVFIGSPNWWSTIAPPIATFLTENNMNGKTVIPFCTHGGGGINRIAKDIEKLSHGATCLPYLEISGGGGSNAGAKIAEWLKKIGQRT